MKSFIYLAIIMQCFVPNVLCEKNNIIELTDSNFVNLRLTVSDKNIASVVSKINKINNKEIFIYINSPGGSVSAGNVLVQQLESLKLQDRIISCIADKAMSMAFIILQHCTNRYVLDSSILMQHQMSLGIQGSLKHVENYLNMVDGMENSLNNYQAKRLGIELEEFNELIESDWWLYGSNAVKKNVADNIMNIICTGNIHEKREVINYESFLGNVKIIFSKCPLIQYPLDIKSDLFKITEENKSEIMSSIMKEIGSYHKDLLYN